MEAELLAGMRARRAVDIGEDRARARRRRGRGAIDFTRVHVGEARARRRPTSGIAWP